MNRQQSHGGAYQQQRIHVDALRVANAPVQAGLGAVTRRSLVADHLTPQDEVTNFDCRIDRLEF